MTSLFRTFVLAVLGLAFAAFGLIRAACASGGTGEAGRLAGVLPAFAAFAGLLSLVLIAARLARRGRDRPAVPPSAERGDAADPSASTSTHCPAAAKCRRGVESTFSGDKPWD